MVAKKVSPTIYMVAKNWAKAIFMVAGKLARAVSVVVRKLFGIFSKSSGQGMIPALDTARKGWASQQIKL